MTIQIEKNIPVPVRTKMPPLPFADMDVGDSFLAPVEADNTSMIQALRQRVARFQRKNPKYRFSVVRDAQHNMMRVFRIQ